MITLEQDFCRGFYTPFEEGNINTKEQDENTDTETGDITKRTKRERKLITSNDQENSPKRAIKTSGNKENITPSEKNLKNPETTEKKPKRTTKKPSNKSKESCNKERKEDNSKGKVKKAKPKGQIICAGSGGEEEFSDDTKTEIVEIVETPKDLDHESFSDVSWDNLDYHVYDAYNTPPFYESEPEEELTMKKNIADLQTRVAKLEEQSETMKSEYFEKECRLLKLISETKAYVIKKTKEKVYQALDNPNIPININHSILSPSSSSSTPVSIEKATTACVQPPAEATLPRVINIDQEVAVANSQNTSLTRYVDVNRTTQRTTSLNPDLVVEKYYKLKIPSKMSTLAVKLARESFFGDELMAKCTVKGTREFGPLPEAELLKLKWFLSQLFPIYAKHDFEEAWKSCVNSIGQACKNLRTPMHMAK